MLDLRAGEPKLTTVGTVYEEGLMCDVLRAHAPPSKALDAKIAAACKRAGGTSQLEGRAFVPAPTKTNLVFRNDGTTLVPSPESARTLARWLEAAPENLMGLPHLAAALSASST